MNSPEDHDPLQYTPPPIAGYRKLTQAEVDLVNEIKAVGEVVGALMLKLATSDAAALTATNQEGARWRAIAKTYFQEGFMCASRSVLKPTSFA